MKTCESGSGCDNTYMHMHMHMHSPPDRPTYLPAAKIAKPVALATLQPAVFARIEQVPALALLIDICQRTFRALARRDKGHTTVVECRMVKLKIAAHAKKPLHQPGLQKTDGLGIPARERHTVRERFVDNLRAWRIKKVRARIRMQMRAVCLRVGDYERHQMHADEATKR